MDSNFKLSSKAGYMMSKLVLMALATATVLLALGGGWQFMVKTRASSKNGRIMLNL